MKNPEAYLESLIDLLDTSNNNQEVASNVFKNKLDMQEKYMGLVPDTLLDFIVNQFRPGMTYEEGDILFKKYSTFSQGGSVTTPKGGAAIETKRKVEGVSEKNLIKLREIIINKAEKRGLPEPDFKKFPGRGYPSNTPGNIMAKDFIRAIKKTGTRGGKDFKTVGTGSGSKALTDPLSKPEKELLENTFTDVDFDFNKSKFGIDYKVNPKLYQQAVDLVREKPKLFFGFQFMKPENYLLTQFQRARVQQLADIGVSQYVPIYKNQKIIGFQDNTEVGMGKKFYHVDYKGGPSIKTHSDFEKVNKYVDIVKDTKGDHIPILNKLFTEAGEKVPTFDKLLNGLLDSPSRGGPGTLSTAIEKHHTKGVKTSTADLQLLTRDQNILAALIEGRVDAGRMDFETASKILKPMGIQIERDGVKIGAPDIDPEKQIQDLKKFVQRKTLEKFAANIKPETALYKTMMQFCPKGKAQGGRIGYSTAGSVGEVTCSIEEAAQGLKEELTKNSNDVRKIKSGSNLLKTAGKFFGWVDAPLEFLFALPHLMVGDIQGAKRATSAGLLGYGGKRINEFGPESKRYVNNLKNLDRWFDKFSAIGNIELDLENPNLSEDRKSFLEKNLEFRKKEIDEIQNNYGKTEYETKEELLKGREKLRQEIQTLVKGNLNKDLTFPNMVSPEDYLAPLGNQTGPAKERDYPEIKNLREFKDKMGEKYAGSEGMFVYKPGAFMIAEELKPGLKEELYGDYIMGRREGKELEDLYSSLPIKYASQLSQLESEDYKNEMLRKRLLEGFSSGGIASLTRTIPPERGPNSQGLASLKEYDKQY